MRFLFFVVSFYIIFAYAKYVRADGVTEYLKSGDDWNDEQKNSSNSNSLGLKGLRLVSLVDLVLIAVVI